MRLWIRHVTRYRYKGPLNYGVKQIRLSPRTGSGQIVVRWETSIEGGKKELHFEDYQGNYVELVSHEPGRTDATVIAEGEVETSDTSGVVGPHVGYVPLWYFRRQSALTEPGPGIRKFAQQFSEVDDAIAWLHALSGSIAERVKFEPGRTDSSTRAEEALAEGHGVCQDHAHLFVSVARLRGIPARYVSGYLQLDDGATSAASHAWAEAHVEGIGWVGFDVANAISPDQRYVRVATGLDYREAAPMRGVLFGTSTEAMEVSVQVQQ